MNIEEQNNEIIAQLVTLNTSIKKNSSKVHVFGTGIVYGLGFFIGSAIIATITLGILGPIFGKIDWVGESFEKGTVLLQSPK